MYTLEAFLTYRRTPEYYIGKWGYVFTEQESVRAEDGSVSTHLTADYRVSRSAVKLHADLALAGQASSWINPEKITSQVQAQKYAENLEKPKHKVNGRRLTDLDDFIGRLIDYQIPRQPHTELARGTALLWKDRLFPARALGFVAFGQLQAGFVYDYDNQAWCPNELIKPMERRSVGLITPYFSLAHRQSAELAEPPTSPPDEGIGDVPYCA